MRAGIAARPQDWAWSSARAHAAARDDGLVSVAPLLERVAHATDLIGIAPDAAAIVRLRAAEASGRPLGDDDFIATLERHLGRSLRPRKRGRKPACASRAAPPEMEIKDTRKAAP